MNLGDLANLGQIIGAIGVMITLVYLAIQIRGSFSAFRFFGQSTQIDLPSLRAQRN